MTHSHLIDNEQRQCMTLNCFLMQATDVFLIHLKEKRGKGQNKVVLCNTCVMSLCQMCICIKLQKTRQTCDTCGIKKKKCATCL